MFLVLIFVPRIIFYENKDLLGWCVVNVQLCFHIRPDYHRVNAKKIIEEAGKKCKNKRQTSKENFLFWLQLSVGVNGPLHVRLLSCNQSLTGIIHSILSLYHPRVCVKINQKSTLVAVTVNHNDGADCQKRKHH